MVCVGVGVSVCRGLGTFIRMHVGAKGSIDEAFCTADTCLILGTTH